MYRIDVQAPQHCVRRRDPGGRGLREVADEEADARPGGTIGDEHEAPSVGEQSFEVLPAFTGRPGRVCQRLVDDRVDGEQRAFESDQLVDVGCLGSPDRHHAGTVGVRRLRRLPSSATGWETHRAGGARQA